MQLAQNKRNKKVKLCSWHKSDEITWPSYAAGTKATKYHGQVTQLAQKERNNKAKLCSWHKSVSFFL
jgi:hypothetical protein